MSTAPTQTTPHMADERSQRRYLLQAGCVDCAGDLTALRQVPGAHRVRFLEATGVIAVDADPDLDDKALLRAAAGSGLTLQRQDPDGLSTPPSAPRWWKRPALIALAASLVLVAAGLVVEHTIDAESLALVLFLAAIGVGGIYPVREAISVLRTRRLSIGVLLVAATIGALALGRVEEAAELVVIFSLGEVLESYAADRARGSIRALMALTPPVAERVSADGNSVPTPVQELNPGDVVLVRPHQRIPTDGDVQDGSSWVDPSAVTGESMPVETTAGAAVYGGTLNGDGPLRIRVTTAYSDTVLARVIRQVEEAQASRGRAQRFAERFGAIYTPAMFALASLVALFGPLAGLTFTEGLYRALVILTVSCSCALVISVPVAVVTAIARGARDGILIKGGAHLEQLARIDTIAFDKTGTLTAGHPALTTIHALAGYTEVKVLTLAAAVEAISTHPIATAIIDAAQQRRLAIPGATEAATVPGIGAHASIDGHTVHVGRIRQPARDGAQAVAALDDIDRHGLTPVGVYLDDTLIGVLGVADQLRPDAITALAQLSELGISRTVMLTGDNPRVAEAVAAQLGITEVRAGLLPEDKTSQVQTLRRQGAVAMVGDGVNDAPAMANAHVAIAMGAAGTDVALETADVALMADDLTRLPAAIRLARRARANITQNIVLSLMVIAGLVTAAMAGAFTLTQGIILNEGTALLIIANGLRLLRHKEA